MEITDHLFWSGYDFVIEQLLACNTGLLSFHLQRLCYLFFLWLHLSGIDFKIIQISTSECLLLACNIPVKIISSNSEEDLKYFFKTNPVEKLGEVCVFVFECCVCEKTIWTKYLCWTILWRQLLQLLGYRH